MEWRNFYTEQKVVLYFTVHLVILFLKKYGFKISFDFSKITVF